MSRDAHRFADLEPGKHPKNLLIPSDGAGLPPVIETNGHLRLLIVKCTFCANRAACTRVSCLVELYPQFSVVIRSLFHRHTGRNPLVRYSLASQLLLRSVARRGGGTRSWEDLT